MQEKLRLHKRSFIVLLVVDFTYPILEGIDDFEPITTTTKSRDIDINKLNSDKYNS